MISSDRSGLSLGWPRHNSQTATVRAKANQSDRPSRHLRNMCSNPFTLSSTDARSKFITMLFSGYENSTTAHGRSPKTLSPISVELRLPLKKYLESTTSGGYSNSKSCGGSLIPKARRLRAEPT